jgi:hypothetical protein
VSAHGCGMVSSRRLPSATRVQLEIIAEKKTANARVLELVPLNDENTSWLLGMELERPGNFWGIKYAPADWAEEEPEAAATSSAAAITAARTSSFAVPDGNAAQTTSTSSPARTAMSVPQSSATTQVTGEAAKQPERVRFHEAPPPAQGKPPAPGKAAATKEIPAAVLRRLLSECRLAAISVGACYVQTGTTFPMHAPVKLVVQAGGTEHSFHGTVRVEHVGAGMGIEFSCSGDLHAGNISDLIDALSANGNNIPQVRVELAAPDKSNPPKSKSASAAAAQYDSLLALVLVGGSLKRTDFLHELEKQRRKA